MRCLINAEWFKLKKSLGFKILLLGNIIITLLMVILYIFVLDSEFTGYRIMKSSLALVLYHAYIGYLFAAIFCCSEFSNRTFAMSLLCGYSRKQVFLSKVIVFFQGMVVLYFEAVGLETIFFSAGNGFGMGFNLDNVIIMLRLLCFGLIGCLTIGAVIIFVAAVAKKSIITFGVGIGCTYVLLWMETTFYDNPLPFVKYLYTYQIRQLNFGGEKFSPGLFLMVMAATFIIALVSATLIFEKSELK